MRYGRGVSIDTTERSLQALHRDTRQANASGRVRSFDGTRGGLGHRCEHKGCEQETREAKPFCPDHIADMPQVSELMERLKAREKEIRRIELRGHAGVRMDDTVAKELVGIVSLEGEITLARLAQTMRLTFEVTDSLVESLSRQGRVQRNCHRGRRTKAVRVKG